MLEMKPPLWLAAQSVLRYIVIHGVQQNDNRWNVFGLKVIYQTKFSVAMLLCYKVGAVCEFVWDGTRTSERESVTLWECWIKSCSGYWHMWQVVKSRFRIRPWKFPQTNAYWQCKAAKRALSHLNSKVHFFVKIGSKTWAYILAPLIYTFWENWF